MELDETPQVIVCSSSVRKKLSGHFATFSNTNATRFSALLAVSVVAKTALIRAPLADLSAEIADFGLKSALSRQGLNTKLADVHTFATAIWAIIDDIFANHFMQTSFAV